MKTENPGSTAPWLLVTRHAVALGLVLAALHRPFYALVGGLDAAALALAVKVFFVLAVAGLCCGLWALFFTKRSHGKFIANYVRLAWMIGLVVSFGEWSNNVQVQIAIAAVTMTAALYEWGIGRNRKQSKAAEANQDKAVSDHTTPFINGLRPTLETVRALVVAAQSTPSIALLSDRVRGRTLLHWCAHYNLSEEALVLLQLGADASAHDGNGCRPGELASEERLAHMLSTKETRLIAGA